MDTHLSRHIITVPNFVVVAVRVGVGGGEEAGRGACGPQFGKNFAFNRSSISFCTYKFPEVPSVLESIASQSRTKQYVAILLDTY